MIIENALFWNDFYIFGLIMCFSYQYFKKLPGLKICSNKLLIVLELGQRKHTKFYIACRFYWNTTVKSHFFFFFNTIFIAFPFLYKFESLGFQMQATDKGGRVETGLIQ